MLVNCTDAEVLENRQKQREGLSCVNMHIGTKIKTEKQRLQNTQRHCDIIFWDAISSLRLYIAKCFCHYIDQSIIYLIP